MAITFIICVCVHSHTSEPHTYIIGKLRTQDMGVMNRQLCLCVPGFLRISHRVESVVPVEPGEEQEDGHDLDSPTCSYRMGLGVHPCDLPPRSGG